MSQDYDYEVYDPSAAAGAGQGGNQAGPNLVEQDFNKQSFDYELNEDASDPYGGGQ